jgi:integrase
VRSHSAPALVPPKKSAMDPKPISREDFHNLLVAADDQMKAMLMLGLNTCCYGGEVAALNWSDLDLDKGTLVTARNKTNVVRVATLWARTVAALARLDRQTDALFLTEAGTQANYLSVYRLFKITRKAAGLETIQFSHIRDGAYTAAVEAGVDLNTCRLLAGHATGISDHYVRRGPRMVAAACEAIEQAYFG